MLGIAYPFRRRRPQEANVSGRQSRHFPPDFGTPKLLPRLTAAPRGESLAFEKRQDPLRLFGRLPVTGVRGCAEAGVRKPLTIPVIPTSLRQLSRPKESMPGTSDLIDDEVGSDSHARQITHVSGNDELEQPEQEEDRACDRRRGRRHRPLKRVVG
jgi:hypothetical protein